LRAAQAEEGRVLMKAASVLFEGEIEVQNSDGSSANVNSLFGRVAQAEQGVRDVQAQLAGSDSVSSEQLAALEGEVQALREDMVTALAKLSARLDAGMAASASKQVALGKLVEEIATRCRPGVEYEAAP